jgi:hypothetical membrane protein
MKNNMDKKMLKYISICGIISPILFALKILIIGFYHPNYNHITQYMSELGAINAPYSIISNAGLSIGGFLIILFSIGFYQKINKNKSINDKIGVLLIFISGLSFFLIGFFPCDPGCINYSTTGIFHGYLSDFAQFPLIIAPLFLLPNFKKTYNCYYIFIFSIIIIILGISFFIIYKSNYFQNYTGLLQRISFGIPLLWLEIIAIKNYKMNFKYIK